MKAKITLFIILCLGVFFNAYAQPEANFAFNQSVNCMQMNFTEGSSCNGCTIATREWDFGDGSSHSFEQSPQHFYNSVGTYNVILKVTDNNANEDTMIRTVVINCIDVQIIADGQIDCFMEDCIILQATPSGGIPPYTYQWSNGSTTGNLNQVCSPGSYTVIVTDMSGAQGIASINLSYQYETNISVNHEGCGSSDGSIIIDFEGTNNITYFWSPGGETTSSLNGLSAGDYSVLVSDTMGCAETFSVTIIDSCGYIAGNVFWDLNQNNILDNGEEPFTTGTIQSTGNNVYESQINSEGSFTVIVGSGNYSTNFVPYLNYYSASPTNHLSQINNSYDSVDFAITPIPGNPDLQIFINPSTPARPGFEAGYLLIAKNVGTDTLSGSIRFGIDSRLSFVSANPNYDSFQNDTMNWNFTDFAPLETMTYSCGIKCSCSHNRKHW
jgi:PKD repeat protein